MLFEDGAKLLFKMDKSINICLHSTFSKAVFQTHNERVPRLTELNNLFQDVYWRSFGYKIKTETLWLGNTEMLGYCKEVATFLFFTNIFTDNTDS